MGVSHMGARGSREANWTKDCGLISIALFILLASTLLLVSCGASQKETVNTVDSYDLAGNLLKNCEETVSDHGSYADVKTEYQGRQVSGLHLNEGYEEWDKAGRPDDGVDYAYYFVYTASGDDYAMLYKNASTACWEISLKDRKGDSFGGRVFVDMEGHSLLSNSVTGSTNSDRAHKEIESSWTDYDAQVSEILGSLDPDYLAKIDPSTSVPRSEPQTGSGGAGPSEIPEGAIPWQEASQHIGETVTIYGLVKDSSYLRDSNGQPAYIDIGAAYPDDSRVTMVVWGEDRGNFPDNPEAMYLGKTVCVTGELYAYEGATYVKVSSSNQIMVLD